MKPRKIILATGIYPPEEGGPATYSKLLTDRLPEFGYEVEVFPFRTVRHLPKWIRHFVYFLKLWRAALRADMVYAQDTVSVGFPALIAAKFSGHKFLIRVPGDYAWEQSVQQYNISDSIDDFQNKKYGFRVELMRSIQKFVVSHADTAIAPSIYFRNLVRGWVQRKEKVITIYNGIDFKEIESKEKKEFAPHTLISAGRLVPWKGFSELVNLMLLLPEWKLAIAGEGPQREVLESQIKEKNLTDRVKLLGSIPRRELLEKVGQSEIFLLNTSFESFSFQLVEVMRVKTPIITTNIGNLAEIIENGTEGILVEPNDLSRMRVAIEEIHGNSVRRDALVKAAYAKSEEFSIERTLAHTAEIINSLI